VHQDTRARLAFKAYEIEELVDVYFYRRLGYVVALAARGLRLSPNVVSAAAGVIGALGGALIVSPRLAIMGIGLLVLYGVVDSADGQLARMTERTSELGRLLDGLAGYATHIAIYLSIFVIEWRAGAGAWTLGAVVVSALCSAIHAQMYDYHRTAYAAQVIHGRLPVELTTLSAEGTMGRLVGVYSATQRALLGGHREVERAIAERAVDGRVSDADRQRYRDCFYGPVRAWNLCGDNVRRYGVAACVLAHHPEWFVPFTLGPMNVVLVMAWLYQRAADRRFLAASA